MLIFGRLGVSHVLISHLSLKRLQNNPDITFGMVDTEANPEISEYFEVSKIPAILIIREQAGIHAQQGEIGAPALDKLIEWARDFDMAAVHAYYAEQDKQKK